MYTPESLCCRVSLDNIFYVFLPSHVSSFRYYYSRFLISPFPQFRPVLTVGYRYFTLEGLIVYQTGDGALRLLRVFCTGSVCSGGSPESSRRVQDKGRPLWVRTRWVWAREWEINVLTSNKDSSREIRLLEV